jgi:predicted N-acetyltransferase YhbS
MINIGRALSRKSELNNRHSGWSATVIAGVFTYYHFYYTKKSAHASMETKRELMRCDSKD